MQLGEVWVLSFSQERSVADTSQIEVFLFVIPIG